MLQFTFLEVKKAFQSYQFTFRKKFGLFKQYSFVTLRQKRNLNILNSIFTNAKLHYDHSTTVFQFFQAFNPTLLLQHKNFSSRLTKFPRVEAARFRVCPFSCSISF